MTDTDPRLTAAVIPPSVLAGLLELADRHGLRAGDWFSGTGLTPEHMTAADVRVSFRQAETVLRRALRALPAGPHGIRVGARDALTSFGMVGFAMRSAETLEDALVLGLEFHQATGSLVDVEGERLGDEVAVRLRERVPVPELHRFLCEEAMTSIQQLIRSIAGPDCGPVRVELSYPRPPWAAHYGFFGCPVRFGAEADRMVFPCSMLARPIPTHNEASLAAAIAACRALVGSDDLRQDVVATVEKLLADNVRSTLSMTEVAERLHITERSLRRRLAAAGTRFSALRDAVRLRRATYLVRETDLPFTRVSQEVGFSDAREFRRAYVRWSGMTPTRARREST
jgi:AraC-like DNA-binding protein